MKRFTSALKKKKKRFAKSSANKFGALSVVEENVTFHCCLLSVPQNAKAVFVSVVSWWLGAVISVCVTRLWVMYGALPQPAAPELSLPHSHKGGSGWRKCLYVIAGLRHSSLPVIG